MFFCGTKNSSMESLCLYFKSSVAVQAASAEGITYTHGYDFTWLKGQQSKGCPIVNVIGADVWSCGSSFLRSEWNQSRLVPLRRELSMLRFYIIDCHQARYIHADKCC